MKLVLVCTVLCGLAAATAAADPVPVVMWHGMGDDCCSILSMDGIKRLVEKNIPGVYVHSLMIGQTPFKDRENGFLMNVNDQVEMACNIIKNDTKLANGFHSMGFSQGGQFLRALAQRCSDGPQMKNLISFGGQHQGVYGFPKCPGDNVTLCNEVRRLLNLGAYIPWIQDFLVQAEYWHDPLNEKEYVEKSVFLAEINNEKAVKNATYKANLIKLQNFVLVKFLNDTMVQPKESEWFGFYRAGGTAEIETLHESALYQQDYIGMKVLDEANKLHFLGAPGDHLQFTDEWFVDNIVPFLKQS